MEIIEKKYKITTSVRLIFLALVLFSGILLCLIIGSSIQNPFYINKAFKMNISFILPQGWAFFTKDAREEITQVFKRLPNGSLTPVTPQISSSTYLFGINREGRRISIEYTSLLKLIDTTAWKRCEYDLKKISSLTSHKPDLVLKNNMYKPLCCKEIVIIKYFPIPWAWSKNKNIKMPSKYLQIYADCSNK